MDLLTPCRHEGRHSYVSNKILDTYWEKWYFVNLNSTALERQIDESTIMIVNNIVRIRYTSTLAEHKILRNPGPLHCG